MLNNLPLNTITVRRTILAVAIAATILPVVAFATSTNGPDGPAMSAMGMYPNAKVQTQPTQSVMNDHGTDGAAMASMGMYAGGMTQIKSIQSALNHRDHSHLMVNGRMDRSTQSALKRFQRAHGLASTGHVDEPTLKALGIH